MADSSWLATICVRAIAADGSDAFDLVIDSYDFDDAAWSPTAIDQGEVLAVGPGKRNEKTGDFIAPNIKVGDRVLFGKYSGQTVKVDGEELLVMKEDDLFAVVVK